MGKDLEGILLKGAVIRTAGLLLLAVALPVSAEPVIQGVYSLSLGQSRAEAEATLAEDPRFQRIAGRFHEGFPLYKVTLGEHELGVRPDFLEEHLVRIELTFQKEASPNDVDPLIRNQVRFAATTLTKRFGNPDTVRIRPSEIVPGSFEDGGQVVTHRWRRGQRIAEIALLRERFTHEVALILAEDNPEARLDSPEEAF